MRPAPDRDRPQRHAAAPVQRAPTGGLVALRARALQALAACLLPGACLLLGACQVDRQLRITSEPEGAEVRVDGEPIGRTPLQMPFVHYGRQRFTFYLDGYVTDSRVVEIAPPWYLRFPLDIVTEILLPFGWRDHHQVHAELVPGTGAIPPPDLSGVLQRAEALRRAGPEGPRPPTPPQESSRPPSP